MARVLTTKLGVQTTLKQFADLFYDETQFDEFVAIYDSHEKKDDLLRQLRDLDDDFAGALFGHEDEEREQMDVHPKWN